MRILISLLLLLFINHYSSQDIINKIEGSWQVKQIDGKIFKGRVITYFEFNSNQEIFAKTIDHKAHGHLNEETFIGKYQVDNNEAYYKNNEAYFSISINKIANTQKSQMVVKEYKLENQAPKKEVYRTTFLIKEN